MFANNLVVAIKVNGKVLREIGDIVYLPFGTEYSVLFKNLSTKNVCVWMTIDGNDAIGDGLVITAGKEVELKRFLKLSNLDVGNAFKFIEKDAVVSAYRGDKAEDGIVTITYEFEKPMALYGSLGIGSATWKGSPGYRGILRGTSGGYVSDGLSGDLWGDSGSIGNAADNSFWPGVASITGSSLGRDTASAQTLGPMNATSNVTTSANYCSTVTNKSDSAFYDTDNVLRSAAPKNTSGITAPGSVVEQKFSTTSFFGDGTKYKMSLMLKGDVGEKPVAKPVTVKRVQKCTMCGTSVRQTAKFCHHCGASVELVV